MNRFALPLRSLLLSALLIGPGGVWAQSGSKSAPRKDQDRGSTLPDSVRRVERQTGGEVLRAEPMQRDGREVYRLKVLTADGRVRVVQDDPTEHGAPPPQERARRGKQAEKPSSSDSDEEPSQF